MVAHSPVVSPHFVRRLSAHGVALRREVGDGFLTRVFTPALGNAMTAVGARWLDGGDLFNGVRNAPFNPADIRTFTHSVVEYLDTLTDQPLYQVSRIMERLIRNRQWFGRVILGAQPNNPTHWDAIESMADLHGMSINRVTVSQFITTAQPTNSDLAGSSFPLVGWFSINGGEPVYKVNDGRAVISRNKNAGIDWIITGSRIQPQFDNSQLLDFAQNCMTAPLPGVSK